jgi:hypothetical protein
MNIQDLRKLVDSTNGKVFHVEFYKADGSLRQMQARIEVTKHLRGGADSTAHKPEIYTVFDMGCGEYRKFNLTKVKSIKCGAISYVA